MKYDVIVVGGGHAGCEAAYITGFLGKKTLLITSDLKNIADLPCNPSIGGSAKGIIVREIDALGGIMGKVADRSHFQIKMLNDSKGPAVRCLRAQVDKLKYPQEMIKYLKSNHNVTLKEATVAHLVVDSQTVKGVVLTSGLKISSQAVILATGTYLKANVLIGSQKKATGPHGASRATTLSADLKKLGFTIQRLKTGTPPRIQADSIDFSKMKVETGASQKYTFSFDNQLFYDVKHQANCYLLYTNEKTHRLIKDHLSESSMYGGLIHGVGPRYCPSIEDKIVRFNSKPRHQLFLEPESQTSTDWYLQGFSTSMPKSIQIKMVHSLVGLEQAVITKYAYAIEYDAIDPLQVKASLETKLIKNLYTAGQINGTSGYEEAAAQGLIAGINARNQLDGRPPLILKRDEAYIGVLIDDLVTKGTTEPYRMMTSRAEFRLILRHDNADLRLREIAYQNNTITLRDYQKYLNRRKTITDLIQFLKTTKLKINAKTKALFTKFNLKLPTATVSLEQLLKRPEINLIFISQLVNLQPFKAGFEDAEIEIKYEGYIQKAIKESEKLRKLERKIIPPAINYDLIKNLATEARQKLKKVRPLTLSQAARISGVNPVDISILAVYLKKEYPNL